MSQNPCDMNISAAEFRRLKHRRGGVVGSQMRGAGGEGVRFGNHSVSGIGICSTLYSELEEAPPSAPHALYGLTTNNSVGLADTVPWNTVDNCYNITSTLSFPTWTGMSVPIERTLKMATLIPNTVGTWTHTDVTLTGGRALTAISPDLLSHFMIGDVPNVESVENGLTPRLLYTDVSVSGILTSVITDNLLKFDAVALYAKGWYITLLQSMITNVPAIVQPPLPAAFPDPPIMLNLLAHDAQSSALELANNISSGSIVHIMEYTIPSYYLMAICWLTSSLNPVGETSNANGLMFPAQTIRWPHLPNVCVYSTDLPVIPAPVRITADEMRAALIALAVGRGELEDFCRGYYYASQLVSSCTVQYHRPNDAITRVVCTPTFECFGRQYLPAPFDYNVLLRCLCTIKWKIDERFTKDVSILRSLPVYDFARAGIIMSALTYSFASTAIYSFGLCAKDLQNSAWPKHNNDIISSILNVHLVPAHAFDDSQLPLLMLAPFEMMSLCCGFTLPTDMFGSRAYWGCAPVNLPADIVNPQDDGLNWFDDAHRYPPMIGNVLAINRWVHIRPLEWGIFNAQPTADFSREVSIRAAGSRRWCALSGDSTYALRASSPRYYTPVMYGVLALNIICQHLSLASMPDLQMIHAVPHCGFSAMFIGWAGPVALPSNLTPEYDNDLHIVKPLTLTSINLRDNYVFAPVIAEQTSFPLENLMRLASMPPNQPVPNAGLFLSHYKLPIECVHAPGLPPRARHQHTLLHDLKHLHLNPTIRYYSGCQDPAQPLFAKQPSAATQTQAQSQSTAGEAKEGQGN